MLCGQEIPHLAKRGHERRDQNALRFFSFRRGRFRQGGQQARQAARLRRGGAVDSGRCSRKIAGRLVDRLQRLSRGRRRVDLVGVEGVLKEEARIVDDGELLVLILRNEAHERPHFGDFRQPAQLFGQGGGVSEIALEDIDRVGARVGIAHQIEERRDRFDISWSVG